MSDFNTEHNRIVWADLPVADLDRAAAFYRAVCGVGVGIETYEGTRFAVMDHDTGNGCCLIVKPDRVGRGTGPLLYFNVEGRLRDAVSKVAPAGGAVEEDVIPIGPHGFRAIVTDSEGNRIALHAQTDG